MSDITVSTNPAQKVQNNQIDSARNSSATVSLKANILERTPDSDVLVKQNTETTKETWLSKIKRLFEAKTYTKEDCNLIRLQTDDVTQILKDTIGDKKYRIATSGYSFNMDGYEHTTELFLKTLDENLGKRKTGYVVPPSLDKGNLYDITTKISGLGADNVMFVTTERYWDKYTDFGKFDEETDLKKYVKTPVHVFPDTETYTNATANASNVLVCTGGRKVAMTEIIEALKRKNKVVLVLNKNLGNGVLNTETNSVENAAEYSADLFSPVWCRKNFPEIKDVDMDFIKNNKDRILQLVRCYVVDDDESIKDAAIRASNFIKSKTLYDYFPEMSK